MANKPSLLGLPLDQALKQVWSWLEDCEDLVALNPHRDLPRPPFRLDEAWIVVRLAAEELATANTPSADAIGEQRAAARRERASHG